MGEAWGSRLVHSNPLTLHIASLQLDQVIRGRNFQSQIASQCLSLLVASSISIPSCPFFFLRAGDALLPPPQHRFKELDSILVFRVAFPLPSSQLFFTSPHSITITISTSSPPSPIPTDRGYHLRALFFAPSRVSPSPFLFLRLSFRS